MLNVSEKRLGSVVVFCLAGPIVIGELSALRKATGELTHLTTLLLDLRSANMIDAAGLGLLLELRQDLKVKGIELRLTNVNERINWLLKITRLDTVFETASSATVLHVNPLTPAIPLSRLAPCA